MDFKITIEESGAAQMAGGSQPAGGGTPSLPGDTGGGLSAGDMAYIASEKQRRIEAEWDAKEDERRQLLDSLGEAAARAKAQSDETQEAHEKRLAALRELYAVEGSAAAEAKRQAEAEAVLWQRQFDVMKERHDIEGAAAEEARRQLAAGKEQRRFGQDVQAEKFKQDPLEAVRQLLERMGGALGSTGSSLLGGVGRVAQMAGRALPAVRDYFTGGGEEETPGATAAAGEGGKGKGVADAAIKGGKLVKKAADMAGKGSEAAEGAGGAEAAAGAEGATAGAEAAAGAEAGGGAAAGMLGELAAAAGPVGLALAAVAAAAYVTVAAFDATSEYFVNLGKQKLAPYSGDIQQAEVQADVRSMMADIREAGTFGEGIGRLIEAQSSASDSIRELLEPIKEVLLEGVTMVTEAFAGAMKMLRDMERELGLLRGFADSIKVVFALLREALVEWGFVTPEDDKIDDVMGDLFERLGRGLPAGGVGVPRPQAPDNAMF